MLPIQQPPIPTDAREKSSEAARAETFFDEHASNSEISRDREAEPADEPPGATLTPEETAALAEMSRLKTALTAASSYGAGVNAAGKPARRRSDSARPSDVLPEAWADFGASQRKSVEAEFAAKRSLLRRQISELKALNSDLDFEQLVRATSSGAVSIIVRRPLSSCDPWRWYDDESAFPGAIARQNIHAHTNSHSFSGAIARENFHSYADAHQRSACFAWHRRWLCHLSIAAQAALAASLAEPSRIQTAGKCSAPGEQLQAGAGCPCAEAAAGQDGYGRKKKKHQLAFGGIWGQGFPVSPGKGQKAEQ